VSLQGRPYLTFERDENGTRMFRNTSNQSNEFGWDDDDACLHFNPSDDDVVLVGESNTPPISSVPSLTTNKTIAVKSPRPTSSKTSPTKTKGVHEVVPSPRKRAGRTETPKTPSKKKIQVVDESDEVWERKMMEKIIRDTDLHLRILRYEPIHFDVFLQLAVEGSSSSGKLKLRLRSFLDKQAIHFYGAVPSTGRGRRR